MQAHSFVAGPQQPTWIEARLQALWALLWWAQLETEHWMLLFALLLLLVRFLLWKVWP